MNLIDKPLITCPTCKDDDCVESYRVDGCSACGWNQYVPLESNQEPDAFQRGEENSLTLKKLFEYIKENDETPSKTALSGIQPMTPKELIEAYGPRFIDRA